MARMLFSRIASKKEEGEAVAAEIEQLGRKAALLQLDVADLSQFDEFFDTVRQALGNRNGSEARFDFLINNAGIDSSAPFDKMTEEDFDRLFLVHFKGVYFLTQKLLPVIADGGAIVCTSTGLARFAIPGYSAYASMKGAIEVLVRYLAKELGPRGISVPMSSPRGRSKPISPRAPLSSIRKSRASSLLRPRLAGSACLTT